MTFLETTVRVTLIILLALLSAALMRRQGPEHVHRHVWKGGP